jgi:hypothetical protein
VKPIPDVRAYVSVCQRQEITFVHGQQTVRPEARLAVQLVRSSGGGVAGVDTRLRPGVATTRGKLQYVRRNNLATSAGAGRPPALVDGHCPVIGHGRVFSALHPIGRSMARPS